MNLIKTAKVFIQELFINIITWKEILCDYDKGITWSEFNLSFTNVLS